MKTLALIPARGGSKGLPHKNILPCHGKPLIAWTIEAALASKVDTVVVSSDDPEILALSGSVGAKLIRRPAELATDTASSVDVAVHAIECFPGYDRLVLLQPTSPMRTTADIDACLTGGNVVSVSPTKSPYWLFWENMEPILPRTEATRRQDLKQAYALNGAVYVVGVGEFMRDRKFVPDNAVPYVMGTCIDIDTREDLLMAEALLRAAFP